MPESSDYAIRMFEETRKLLDCIADQQRWTLKVAMDEAAKALAEKLNIERPGEKKLKAH